MNRMLKGHILVVLFLSSQLLAQNCSAGGLELFIALRRMYDSIDDKVMYVKPSGGKIKIRQRPMPFYVVIENTSGSSKKLWESGLRNGRAYFSIEFKNNKGQKTTIRKKETKELTGLRTYEYINPDEQIVKRIF